MKRRDFLVGGVQAAAAAPLAAIAAGPASAEITQRTVEAAEKIHAVTYSSAQRAELAAALPAQEQALETRLDVQARRPPVG